MTSVELERVALKYVVRWLADEYQFNMRLDESDLLSVGLSPDHVISTEQRNMPLAEALQRTFDEFELAIAMRDGVVWLTTDEEAERMFTIRVYPVGDLLAIDPVYEPIELVQLIQSTAGAGAWESFSGSSQIESLNDLLAIRATGVVHREVSELLAGPAGLATGEPSAKLRVSDRQRPHNRADV